jgi:NAD(P)-dependent dehydrogenase (short-subunit alcohol dehydrogenase family)
MASNIRFAAEHTTEAQQMTHSTALIVGAGAGLSAALTRRLRREGYGVALAARSIQKLRDLEFETGAKAFACDAIDAHQVERLFDQVTRELGEPELVVYNASARVRGALVELDPLDVERSIAVSAFGGFLVSQAAVRHMLPRARGVILLTGASASVKGYAQSAAFAMGKFALRGLAQSMARELSPLGIHVAHIVIDGAIRAPGQPADPAHPDSRLEPDAIADTYFQLARQPRSAWSWEIELRPWVERF